MPPVDARTLHQEGQAAYAAGRYEEAIEKWLAAFALEPRAGIQYNLSQGYGRLGRLPEERAALERFIAMLAREAPERMSDSQVESARLRIVAIDDRLRNTGIELRGAPRRARLSLDGEPVTLVDGVVPTTAGSHVLRVEVEGYAPFTTTVTVGHGLRAEVDVELELASDESDETRRVRQRHHRRVAIGLSVTGAAVIGAGAVLGLVAVGDARGSFAGSEQADSARALGIGADAAFGVGGGLLATAFVLWRVHHGDGDTPASAPVLVPVVGIDTLGVGGRF